MAQDGAIRDHGRTSCCGVQEIDPPFAAESTSGVRCFGARRSRSFVVDGGRCRRNRRCRSSQGATGTVSLPQFVISISKRALFEIDYRQRANSPSTSSNTRYTMPWLQIRSPAQRSNPTHGWSRTNSSRSDNPPTSRRRKTCARTQFARPSEGLTHRYPLVGSRGLRASRVWTISTDNSACDRQSCAPSISRPTREKASAL
jgi:hypothetical protein